MIIMATGFIFCNPSNANVAPKLATLTGGYVTIEPIQVIPSNPNWRALIVKGTGAQLVALNGSSGVIGICALTPSSNYPELKDTVDATKRGTMNTYLGANGYGLIGADWTNVQVITYILQTLFHNNYDIRQYQVMGTAAE